MKDEVYLGNCASFENVIKKEVNDCMNYYNKDCYQRELVRLPPAQYLKYLQTGIYHLKI